jgi:DNA mismatch repair protein MutH
MGREMDRAVPLLDRRFGGIARWKPNLQRTTRLRYRACHCVNWALE